jgi:hypothetical protein
MALMQIGEGLMLDPTTIVSTSVNDEGKTVIAVQVGSYVAEHTTDLSLHEVRTRITAASWAVGTAAGR